MRRIIPLSALILALCIGSALAQPRGPGRPPVWDSRGWVSLGERTVNGRVDRDRIEVGRQEGRFTKLMLVVEDSDVELIEFKVVFGDNTSYSPRVDHYFREGQRTRAIDMPPNDAASIRHIEFRYRNLPGGGSAKVQIWGLRTGAAVPPPAPPPPPPAPIPPRPPAWDSRGWTLLGERTVDGRVDRDRIEVGRYEGKFTKLMIVVEDSDLELIDFAVQFGRGAPWRPAVQHYFREGQRTHAIDFPGDERTIRHIDVRYRNLPGGGRAKIAVYGQRDQGPGGRPGPVGPAWDSRGWTMLGEQRVDDRRRRPDVDRISVSRWDRKYRRLTVVVLDSDLELYDLAIKFGRGEPFHPRVEGMFREGTRTRVIDLPGDDRAIRWIEFRYRNLPGGGAARVQVWAQ